MDAVGSPEPVIRVLFALFTLWWGVIGFLALRGSRQIWAQMSRAPEDLRGPVRATAARLASQAVLRLGFIGVLLDVVIDGDVDWALALVVAALVLFVGTAAWNAAVYSRHRGDARLQRWTRTGSWEEEDMSSQDEMVSQPYEDPGWLRAFKTRRTGGLSGTKGADVDGVVIMRVLFLSLTLAALLILFVLTFIFEEVGVPDPALGSVVVGLGVAGVAAAAWSANRKLDTSTASALAESYRSNFFLGFALNEAPLLTSFVFCFIQDELWPYLVALPLYLVGMALIAPGRRNLERRQEQVHRQGSTLSLGRALSSVPRRSTR